MKIALLHRYPQDQIKSTNAAFPYLAEKGMDVLTFKKFNRLSGFTKFWKSVAWIFYAPFLVLGKGYDVIYCDDSYPFYPFFVKLISPKSKVVIRLGDLHLMYYYSGFAYKFLHFIEKIVWRKVDGIIAISYPMARYVMSESDRWVDTVFDPIDPSDFEVTPKNNPDKIVMFHGVLTKNKRVDLLIRAAERMKDVQFWVIGDGPDLKRLQKIAPSNVWFGGWYPFESVCNLISQCSVGVALRGSNPGNEFVVTSPFLQYGIMGKPCLVTRREVFGDYDWQFSNVNEMVEKLTLLLASERQNKVIGQKLQAYVLANHEAKKVAEEIWKILL